MASKGNKQEIGFLAATLGFTLVMGLSAFFSIVTPVDLPPAVVASRGPASEKLGKIAAFKPETPVQVPDSMLEWSCGEGEKSMSTQALRVRIRGKNCPHGVPEIQNLTSGASATSFNAEKVFTTEYFDLKPGTNEIKVQWMDRKGQPSERILKIDRLPANLETL